MALVSAVLSAYQMLAAADQCCTIIYCSKFALMMHFINFLSFVSASGPTKNRIFFFQQFFMVEIVLKHSWRAMINEKCFMHLYLLHCRFMALSQLWRATYKERAWSLQHCSQVDTSISSLVVVLQVAVNQYPSDFSENIRYSGKLGLCTYQIWALWYHLSGLEPEAKWPDNIINYVPIWSTV